MKTTHKGQKRLRCDYCKGLILPRDEGKATIVDGDVLGKEARWYHFCNRSQFEKWCNQQFQLHFDLWERENSRPSNTGVKSQDLTKGKIGGRLKLS